MGPVGNIRVDGCQAAVSVRVGRWLMTGRVGADCPVHGPGAVKFPTPPGSADRPAPEDEQPRRPSATPGASCVAVPGKPAPWFQLARGFAARLDCYLHAGRVLAAVLGGEIIHLQLVDGEGRAKVETRNTAVREADRAVVQAPGWRGRLSIWPRPVGGTGHQQPAPMSAIFILSKAGITDAVDRVGRIHLPTGRGERRRRSACPGLAGLSGGRINEAGRMTAGRLPLFCDTALAERIERAEAQLIAGTSQAARARRADGAGFVIPVAGGVASFAEQDSPFNKVAGLGFAGAPEADALDEVEQAFAACGSAVQVELASLGDPAIGVLLTGRGYRLVSFENVLGRAVTGEPERVTPPGVEVRRCGEEEFDAWIGVVVDAFGHPDAEGVPQHEQFPREAIERAERDLVAAGGVTCYLALCDGVIAGGATMRTAEGLVQFGAATAPAYRRRGVQTALLAARLADAAAAGSDIAVVATQPGSKSQQNVQRRGFDLLYTRAVLVKQP
jgi:hypothetical protein